MEAETFDLFLEVDGTGKGDIQLACNQEAIGNLIRTRLFYEVNWSIINDPLIVLDIKKQIIRKVVLETTGVVSVDLSGFGITDVTNNNINFGVICPTIDCDNSQVCVTL